MIKRKLLNEINEVRREYRVITLVGPRQSGKTTLARSAFPDYLYVSLEDPDVRSFAKEDPRAFFHQYQQNVVIDEIQRLPELLSYMQTIVDQKPDKAQFVLTGSHQFELSEAVSQSLAGRTALLTLLPLSLEEIDTPASVWEIALSGFMPEVHAEQLNPQRYFQNYFRTYVERDVRRMMNLKDLSLFEKFIRLVAGRTGQLTNFASLASDVGVSETTIKQWLSILEASFIVWKLPPYFENFGKRLIKSPKVYFYDTGLLCWLLKIETEQQLLRDPLMGVIFENLVVTELVKAQANRGLETHLHFYRDSHGNEVDVVLQKGRQLKPVEIKAAQTWNNSFLKGIDHFRNVVGDRGVKGAVVYGGSNEREASDYSLLSYLSAPQLIQ